MVLLFTTSIFAQDILLKDSVSTLDANALRDLADIVREHRKNEQWVIPTTVTYGDFDSYDKYIDRPFAITEQNIDDTRAEGQEYEQRRIAVLILGSLLISVFLFYVIRINKK